jgi:hypothetical protein
MSTMPSTFFRDTLKEAKMMKKAEGESVLSMVHNGGRIDNDQRKCHHNNDNTDWSNTRFNYAAVTAYSSLA